MNKITISTIKGFFQLENVFCVNLNIDNRCLLVMYTDKADNEDKKIHIPIDEIIEFNIK